MTPHKSILVVDDHQIVSSGIKLIFHTKEIKFDVINVLNGDEAFQIMKHQTFDLIIMDVNLPDTDTFQLINLILNLYPAQKILIFSMSSEKLYAKRFLKLGVMGYLSKNESNDEFLRAVMTVLNDEIYLSNYMIKEITKDAIKGHVENIFEKLSPREFEIMTYFLKGNGNKEVSNITRLHSSTIGTYKFKIFEKLGVKNIIELEELAIAKGIKNW